MGGGYVGPNVATGVNAQNNSVDIHNEHAFNPISLNMKAPGAVQTMQLALLLDLHSLQSTNAGKNGDIRGFLVDWGQHLEL